MATLAATVFLIHYGWRGISQKGGRSGQKKGFLIHYGWRGIALKELLDEAEG